MRYLLKRKKNMYKRLKVNAPTLTLCAVCAKRIQSFHPWGWGIKTLTEPKTSQMMQRG